MGDWPVGLSTGCFYKTSLFECLEPIRSRGFGMLEICSFPAHLDYHDRHWVERAAGRIRELNMEAYSFHAPFAEGLDISAMDRDLRERSMREMLIAAEAAAVLGVRYFVVHPGPETGWAPPEEYLQRMEHVAGILNVVARRCRELGVGLVLENKLPHLFAGNVRDLMWILGALEADDVGICLDTGHAYLSRDLHTVTHKLSGHLWMLHASDNRGSFDDHLPPGEGAVDWDALLRQLGRSGFRGGVILEISGDGEVGQVLDRASRARTFLRRLSSRLEKSR